MSEITELIERIKQGDSEAFGKIFEEYSRMVASVLHKVGRCPLSEMDFHLNEVFFRIYKGIFQFKGNSKFSTFAYRIALNYSFHLSKQVKRHRMENVELEDDSASVQFEGKSVNSIAVERALESLPETLRSVTVMYYYDDMPVKEIAEVIQISENAVKNRLFQARDKIKKYFGEVTDV